MPNRDRPQNCQNSTPFYRQNQGATIITPKTQTNNAETVLKEIEKASKKEFLPIIGPTKGKILAQEVRKAKPLHVLEVGTLVGYSAILIGRELNEKAEIVAIEIHSDETQIADENITKAKIPPKVTIITGDAIEVIPTLNGPIDFAFIDAEKREYRQYLNLAEDKFHKGTVVFADNAGIFAEQMSDYLDYVRSSGKYQSRYIQVAEDGVEISIKI